MFTADALVEVSVRVYQEAVTPAATGLLEAGPSERSENAHR